MLSRTLLNGVVLGLQILNILHSVILRIFDIWGSHCNESEGMKPYRLVVPNVPVDAIAFGSYRAVGRSAFLWDVGNSLPDCTVSHASRQLPLYLSLTKFHTKKSAIKTALLFVLIFKILRQNTATRAQIQKKNALAVRKELLAVPSQQIATLQPNTKTRLDIWYPTVGLHKTK